MVGTQWKSVWLGGKCAENSLFERRYAKTARVKHIFEVQYSVCSTKRYI